MFAGELNVPRLIAAFGKTGSADQLHWCGTSWSINIENEHYSPLKMTLFVLLLKFVDQLAASFLLVVWINWVQMKIGWHLHRRLFIFARYSLTWPGLYYHRIESKISAASCVEHLLATQVQTDRTTFIFVAYFMGQQQWTGSDRSLKSDWRKYGLLQAALIQWFAAAVDSSGWISWSSSGCSPIIQRNQPKSAKALVSFTSKMLSVSSNKAFFSSNKSEPRNDNEEQT